MPNHNPKTMFRTLLIILFFSSYLLYSQDEPYIGLNVAVDGPGSDAGFGIIIVDDGYIIDMGHLCEGGLTCVGVAKTDFTGEVQWTQKYSTYPTSLFNQINTIFQDEEGHFLIPRSQYSTESKQDFFLLKLDENGDSLWKKTYAFQPGLFLQDWGGDAVSTEHGGYLMAGTTELSSEFLNEVQEIYYIKTDENGSIVWEKRYAYQDYRFYSITDINKDIDGGYVISGAIKKDTMVSLNYRAIFKQGLIVKIDSLGEVVWEKTYGYSLKYDNIFVIETETIPDGSGYIMTSAVPKDTVNYDWDNQELKEFYVARLDTEGEIVWQHNFPSQKWKYIKDLLLTKDEKYVIGVGENHDHNLEIVGNYSTGWLFKIDIETGELLWERDYVSLDHLFVPIFQLNSIAEADNGTLVAIGKVRDTIPDSDLHFGMVWLLTLDLEGCPEAGTCEDADSVVYLNLQEVTDDFYMNTQISPFQIYPNPTQDYLIIEQPQPHQNKPLHCKIYNGTGQLVHEQKLNISPTKITVNTLKSGIYLCQLQDENGIHHSEKILIQR